jgi:hypothetical protein
MASMQRRVGNARLSRLLDEQAQHGQGEERDKGKDDHAPHTDREKQKKNT